MSGGSAMRTDTFSAWIMQKLKKRESEMDAGNALVLNTNSDEKQIPESKTERPVVESNGNQKRRVA